MKKIIVSCIFLTTLISCGSPDGTSEDTDGLAPDNHRIFVTSTSYQGNLEGQSGADAKCITAARSAGLVRTYVAVLSTGAVNGSANHQDRINITGGVYIFSSSTEKVLVAGSSTDFWAADSKDFLNTVNIDELYGSASGVKVWSGTGVDGGDIGNENCDDWKDSTTNFTGFYGNPDSLQAAWIENNSETCNNSNRIYCISQQ